MTVFPLLPILFEVTHNQRQKSTISRFVSHCGCLNLLKMYLTIKKLILSIKKDQSWLTLNKKYLLDFY